MSECWPGFTFFFFFLNLLPGNRLKNGASNDIDADLATSSCLLSFQRQSFIYTLKIQRHLEISRLTWAFI